MLTSYAGPRKSRLVFDAAAVQGEGGEGGGCDRPCSLRTLGRGSHGYPLMQLRWTRAGRQTDRVLPGKGKGWMGRVEDRLHTVGGANRQQGNKPPLVTCETMIRSPVLA